MDLLVPIVFPDYRIAIELPKAEVDVFPWVDFDNFTMSGYKDRWSNLGHAGVLFVNGANGQTKYYEYGRYDAEGLGLVRRSIIPDARADKGSVLPASLVAPLRKIAIGAGQGGRIEGVFIEVQGRFGAMLAYAEGRKVANSNRKRPPYSILSNSCIHFVKAVAQAAGVHTPWMLDPRPNSYIGEFRSDFPDLDFDPKTAHLSIEGTGQY